MDRLPDSYTEEDLGAAEPFAKFHKLSMMRAISKRLGPFLAVWMFVFAAGIVIGRLVPLVYRAEAVVLVDSQKIPENFVTPTVGGELPDRLASINEHIMSSERLLDAINAFHLYEKKGRSLTHEELLQRMRRDVSVEFEKSSTGGRMQSFRLRYQCSDPQLAARVANRLAGFYVAENARSREDQAAGTVTFLAGQLAEAKASLDEQENRVALFKQQHAGSLPEQESSLLAMLNSLNLQLQGVQSGIDRAQENRLSLQSALSAAESSDSSLRAAVAAPARSFSDAGHVMVPRSEVLEEKLQTLRVKYTADHPAIETLEREIAEAKTQEASQLAAAVSESKTKASASANGERPSTPASPLLIQSHERIAMLQSQLQVAGRQIDSVEKQRIQITSAISECQSRIQKLPLVEQEMVSLKRNYEQSANTYNSLLQKKLAAGIATDMERSQKAEQFKIVDPAHPPQSPMKPMRLLLSLGGLFAGLVLGAAACIALDIKKQTFSGEWQLPAGVPVFGRIPVLPRAQSTIVQSGWNS